MADAPVNLVYVADYARMTRGSDADKDFYSAADTGFISQNVYLYCASEGLATVGYRFRFGRLLTGNVVAGYRALYQDYSEGSFTYAENRIFAELS